MWITLRCRCCFGRCGSGVSFSQTHGAFGRKIVQRDEASKEVFHLYEFRVKKKIKRNPLVSFLRKKKIDAKIHYPVPMHLQPAAKKYGYKKGDFPNAELIANTTISLPVHEFISIKQLKFMATTINYFFSEY